MPLPKRFPDRKPIAPVRAEAAALDVDAEGSEHRLAGRVLARRDMGKLMFLDLVDRSGRIQLIVRPDELGGVDVDIHTSASIGIAMFPGDGKSVETLIANADAAMYCAKQRGRNNIQCYTARMNAVTQDKVKLESDLHEALAQRQFELHY